MSLHISAVPAFDSQLVTDLRVHLRDNGTRVAVATESAYDGYVLSEVIVVFVVDDEGQDWYGVYDNNTFDDALVSDSFETACELMESMANEIAPDGAWDFEQVAPRPCLPVAH